MSNPESSNLTMETILKAKEDMNKTAGRTVGKSGVLTDDQKPIDETEAAAYFINQAHNEFRRLAFALADKKKHSVSRVLEAVLFEPLEKIELLGKHEQELFDICQQVMYNKGKVLQYAFNRMETLKKGEQSGRKES